MKKWILRIGMIATTLIMLLGILYFFNGSLEMYPTDEQIEKAKGAAVSIIIVSFIIDIVLIKLERRMRLCEKTVSSDVLSE